MSDPIEFDPVDLISAGAGNDLLYAAEGNDVLFGGSGVDLVDAGSGNDLLDATAELANSYLEGNSGNDTLLGGAFGRRGHRDEEFVIDAVLMAKEAGKPVKVMWTREDDMRAGYFRPLNYHVLKAGLDAKGRIVAWHHRIVGQSILAGTAFESGLVKNGTSLIAHGAVTVYVERGDVQLIVDFVQPAGVGAQLLQEARAERAQERGASRLGGGRGRSGGGRCCRCRSTRR